MELYGTPVKDESNNPKNRFLFCFCHSYEVDKGWGCGCCGCRAFPFSLGVILFSIVMLISAIKDIVDILSSNYISDKYDNSIFKIFFYIKIVGDVICILGIFTGLTSVKNRSYGASVVAYYLTALCFLLNTSFCVYVLTCIFSASFWWNVGITKIITVVSWYIIDYILLLFTWILFCNMVDIDRKIKEEKSKNPYQFGF